MNSRMERRRECQQRYRERNQESIGECNQNYYEEHLETTVSEPRLDNIEAITVDKVVMNRDAAKKEGKKERNRKYREKHREILKQRCKEYRQRKKNDQQGSGGFQILRRQLQKERRCPLPSYPVEREAHQKERRKEHNRRYREKNREALKQRHKEYQQRKKKFLQGLGGFQFFNGQPQEEGECPPLSYLMERVAEEKERRKEHNRRYRERHRETIRQRDKDYRQRKRNDHLGSGGFQDLNRQPQEEGECPLIYPMERVCMYDRSMTNLDSMNFCGKMDIHSEPLNENAAEQDVPNCSIKLELDDVIELRYENEMQDQAEDIFQVASNSSKFEEHKIEFVSELGIDATDLKFKNEALDMDNQIKDEELVDFKLENEENDFIRDPLSLSLADPLRDACDGIQNQDVAEFTLSDGSTVPWNPSLE